MSSLWPSDANGESAPLVSRFSIALLSSVLLGMAAGYALPGPIQLLAGTAGGIGMLFYLYRTWFIRVSYDARVSAMQERLERRLDCFMPLPHAG